MTEILTFRAAGELWAIPLAAVREVVTVPRVTHLPLTPAAVAGIIELHGAAVAAIDFATVAGASPAAPGSAIVLGRSALLVDSIRDVLSVDAVDGGEKRFVWTDCRAANATLINPARLLEEIQ